MSRVPSNDAPVLRYHRFGGGHRREDVEAALTKLLATVKTVESTLDELRGKSAELEQQLHAKEGELAAYYARKGRLEYALRRAERVLERAEDAAGA